MLKRYSLEIALVYGVLLTIVSLINSVDVPSLGSSFDDKIYHTIAYILLTLLLYNYLLTKEVKNKILLASFVSIAFGILIEILQSLLTNSRVSDVKDVLANSFGVIIAVVFIAFFRRLK